MEKIKIGAVIQARMNSSRYPGKIKEIFGNKTLLETVVDSVNRSKSIQTIIIATTKNKEDDWIEVFFKNYKNVFVFRGDENDVLLRFALAIEKYNLDIVVRITADDPFKPSWLIDELINCLLLNNYDYASNTIQPSFPEGLDIEVFTSKALFKANKCAKKASEREHVTPYIWKNSSIFNCHSEIFKKNLSWARLTIDYKEDLERLQKIFNYLGDNIYSKEILNRFLDDNYLINLAKSQKMRNEGYHKSLKGDVD
tara:strand:- start:41 stop:802 length:762 start_codon:yes stop_codon:yes gene_type:complete